MTHTTTTTSRASAEAIAPRGHRGLSATEWRIAGLLFALALMVFGIAQLGVVEDELLHDSAHYMEIARSIARGEGYTTQTHWALNINPPVDAEGPRFPDTYRAPAYPLLIAGLYKLTGNLFDSARWVVSLLGAFLPPLVFLFVHRRLGLPLAAAGGAGLVTALHHHLVISGSRPLTETPYTLGVFVTFYLLASKRAGWAGLATGITWLFRTQGMLLIPIALASFWWWQKGEGRPFLRQSLVYLVLFGLVISPWVYRTFSVTGMPFYSDLKYHVLSSHDPNIVPFEYELTTFEYFHGLTPAPEPLAYMLDHPTETLGHAARGLKRLARMGLRENSGNVALAAFAIVGAVALWRRRSRDPSGLDARQILLLAGAFGVMNVGLVATSFVDHRHLTSLDPFFAIAGAVGLWVVYQGLAARKGAIGVVAAIALAVGTLGWEAAVAYRTLAARTPYSWLEADLTAAAIGTGIYEPGAIMAKKPYYFSYRLDRPAVSLPWCADEDFVALVRKHDVRYVAIGDQVRRLHAYPGSFMDRDVDPPWLRPIVKRVATTAVMIYEVVPEFLPPQGAQFDTSDANGQTAQSRRSGNEPPAQPVSIPEGAHPAEDER